MEGYQKKLLNCFGPLKSSFILRVHDLEGEGFWGLGPEGGGVALSSQQLISSYLTDSVWGQEFHQKVICRYHSSKGVEAWASEYGIVG